MALPCRRHLCHTPPPWVAAGSTFFVTLCAADRGGSSLLAPGVPAALLASARHYHDIQRWHCHLMLIMPDHIHALLALPAAERLASTVAQWKGFTRRHLALHWQRNFFDHRIRSPAELEAKANYIRLNPVRAGLIATPADWPWQWQPDAPW